MRRRSPPNLEMHQIPHLPGGSSGPTNTSRLPSLDHPSCSKRGPRASSRAVPPSTSATSMRWYGSSRTTWAIARPSGEIATSTTLPRNVTCVCFATTWGESWVRHGALRRVAAPTSDRAAAIPRRNSGASSCQSPRPFPRTAAGFPGTWHTQCLPFRRRRSRTRGPSGRSAGVSRRRRARGGCCSPPDSAWTPR